MDAKLVANYLTSLKEKNGLTYEAWAEKCNRSESTIKNLCTGKTEDPRLDTVAPVTYAGGGSIDEMFLGKPKDKVKEFSIESLKELYEFQLAEYKTTEEAHISNIRAHYEQHRDDVKENYESRLADKREIIAQQEEHIKTLKKENLISKILTIICVAVLVGLLIAEVMNPNLGWFRY